MRPGNKLYVFDLRYHQKSATPQPIEEKIECSPPISAAIGLTGYAPLLTNSFNS